MNEPSGPQERIRTVVYEFLVRELLPGDDSEGLVDTTPLLSGGVLDSIAVVKLVDYFEERFDLKFESREITYENFDTIAKMVGVIESKIS